MRDRDDHTIEAFADFNFSWYNSLPSMTNKKLMPIYDVLIIGSGAAGLALTLSLANKARVAVISKDGLIAGSSPHAQGGIAAVINTDEDSVDLHAQDTLNAGSGLCDTDVVRTTVMQAKSVVEWLTQQGVQFSTEGDRYHLTQEGGHSQRRILHVADKTGAAVITALAEQVKKHPNIDCFTKHVAIDLHLKRNRCIGALVYSNQQKRMLVFNATCTVLATGGSSFLYLHTSNPSCTSGDGIAMAWRAGCRVANLEFNQFHPTCLYHPGANYHLITEVVRGEGGYLLLPNGERFMPRYDKRAEMAPRDIVARAIHTELKNHQLDCVYLDISHRPADFIKKTFPTIYSTCLKFNLDITKEPLPIVPAAHYTCGGVMTDLNGQTDIPGLYAIGEVAYTGLHGANRIASNSLLECLVFAANCARVIKKKHHREGKNTAKKMNYVDAWIPIFTGMGEEISTETLTKRIREIMWDNVGIVRSNASLNNAKKELQPLLQKIETIFPNQPLSKSLIELRSITTVAMLMIESALYRKESRGLHYNVDYPQTSSQAVNTILTPPNSMPTTSEIIEKRFWRRNREIKTIDNACFQ